MDNKSLSHTRWKCQYHIVFIPIARPENNAKKAVLQSANCKEQI